MVPTTNREGKMRLKTMVYCDPSAAHEKALELEHGGAYRVTITPIHRNELLPEGCHVVTAWFRVWKKEQP